MMISVATSFLANGSWMAAASGLPLNTLPAISPSENSSLVTPQRQSWLGKAKGTMAGLSLLGPDTVQGALKETALWEQHGTEPMIYFLEWADRATIPLLLLAVGGLTTFAFHRLKKRGGLDRLFPLQQVFIRPEPEPEPQPVPPAKELIPPTLIDPLDELPTPVSRRIVTPEDREIKFATAKNPDGSFQIPGYSIIRELGRGGMGVVFLASKADLANLLFAIKILKPDLIADKKSLARFKREADMHGRLNCPNTVRIHQYGVVGDQPFMVLEYVAGGNLLSWIQSKKLDPNSTPKIEREAASIVIGCLKGLEVLHQNGLVHRDIKPGNIFLDENGIPKLGDFGLARPREGSKITEEGKFSGTVEYLPKEVLAGEKHDIRADIYSLGVTLFEMVTQRLPFELGGEVESPLPALVVKIFNEAVPDPRIFNPSLSEELAAIILKAMNKEKEGRFQTPAEFKAALLGFLKEDTPHLGDVDAAPPTQTLWQLKG